MVQGIKTPMNDPEDFLMRWTRRKRAAALNTSDQSEPKIADGGAQSEASAAVAVGETPPPFDPASLPPIESIGTGSDIQAFLAAGVPADLTRAALRRAWLADPAIRDFIGLSENSWDFNAPDGVPGFGLVKTDDIRRLLAQVMGEREATDPALTAPAILPAEQATVPVSGSTPAGELAHQQLVAHNSPQDQLKLNREIDPDPGKPTPRENVNVAMQPETGEPGYGRHLSRRGHGGALPK
jgi:hypothetical protein